MRKLFTLTTVASGAAIGMIVAGILAIVGGGYAHKVVHDQLAPQKIYFAADASQLPPSIRQYAGQQVLTGAQAKVFANEYIAVHLQETAGGRTYSQVSEQWLKGPWPTPARDCRVGPSLPCLEERLEIGVQVVECAPVQLGPHGDPGHTDCT